MRTTENTVIMSVLFIVACWSCWMQRGSESVVTWQEVRTVHATSQMFRLVLHEGVGQFHCQALSSEFRYPATAPIETRQADFVVNAQDGRDLLNRLETAVMKTRPPAIDWKLNEGDLRMNSSVLQYSVSGRQIYSHDDSGNDVMTPVLEHKVLTQGKRLVEFPVSDRRSIETSGEEKESSQMEDPPAARSPKGMAQAR